MKGAAHRLGQNVSVFHLDHPLRHAPIHQPVVHMLEGLARQVSARHLADK